MTILGCGNISAPNHIPFILGMWVWKTAKVAGGSKAFDDDVSSDQTTISTTVRRLQDGLEISWITEHPFVCNHKVIIDAGTFKAADFDSASLQLDGKLKNAEKIWKDGGLYQLCSCCGRFYRAGAMDEGKCPLCEFNKTNEVKGCSV